MLFLTFTDEIDAEGNYVREDFVFEIETVSYNQIKFIIPIDMWAFLVSAECYDFTLINDESIIELNN